MKLEKQIKLSMNNMFSNADCANLLIAVKASAGLPLAKKGLLGLIKSLIGFINSSIVNKVIAIVLVVAVAGSVTTGTYFAVKHIFFDEPAVIIGDDDEPDDKEPDEEPDDQEPDDQEPDDQEPDDQEPDDEEPDDQEPDDQEPDDQEPDDEEPDDEEPDDEEPDDEEPDDEEPDDEEPTLQDYSLLVYYDGGSIVLYFNQVESVTFEMVYEAVKNNLYERGIKDDFVLFNLKGERFVDGTIDSLDTYLDMPCVLVELV